MKQINKTTKGIAALATIFSFITTSKLAQAGSLFGLEYLKGTNIPQQTDPNAFIVGIVNTVTGVLAAVLIAMLVYGGVLYMTSAGNDDRVKSGKNTLTYAIIGMIVVAAARIIAQFVINAVT